MTTKEIAVKCGVTEQSIRNWCKKNNAPKAKQSANGKIAYLITDEVERKILEYYNIICDEKAKQVGESKISDEEQEKNDKISKISENIKEKQTEESETSKEKQEKNVLEIELVHQLQSKDMQLAEKDKQISELQAQNKALIEALNNAQENNKSLTDALVAAQTLHAATIQTTALVDKSAEPERKWWQKIFKKKEG